MVKNYKTKATKSVTHVTGRKCYLCIGTFILVEVNAGVPLMGHNPFGVDGHFASPTQGSSFLATLGFVAEFLWDSGKTGRS
jgi:hypothetical protein